MLRARTGHDFSEYKDRTFQRRVQRRMQVVQTTKIEDYLERLQKEPAEVGALLRDLLIGVTNFFRDAAAFDALETLVVPKLFAGRGRPMTVRIWVAGCATGEEAYSIAMLLREQMDRLDEPPRCRSSPPTSTRPRSGVARAARYPANSGQGGLARAAGALLRVRGRQLYRWRKEMRDMCIFSAHSVIRDPPFSRLDLISCRNLLIYLKQPTCRRRSFRCSTMRCGRAAICSSGCRKTLPRHNDLFAPLDKQAPPVPAAAIWSPRPHLQLRQFLPRGSSSATGPRPQAQRADLLRQVAGTDRRAFRAALCHRRRGRRGRSISRRGTGRYLQAAAGPATRDIVRHGAPGLARRAACRARSGPTKSGRRVTRDRVAVQIDDDRPDDQPDRRADDRRGSEIALYLVVFIDLGPARAQVEAGAEHPESDGAAVQQVEKELRETKDRLQSTIEELETANEELTLGQRGAAVGQRGTAIHQRGTGNLQGGDAIDQRGAAHRQHRARHKIEELDRANSDLQQPVRKHPDRHDLPRPEFGDPQLHPCGDPASSISFPGIAAAR